jgi:acyl carrier protein
MKQLPNKMGAAPSDVMSVIAEAVRGVSAKAKDIVISPESSLIEDLALDSLDLVAVVLRLQDHFQIEIDPDELPTMRSVGDLIASLDKHFRSAA